MLFGEYLINRKLVTQEQVLEALIEQIRSTPSTAEVFFRCKLVSTSDLLRILSNQQRRGLDFCSSATELNLWTDAVAQSLSDEIRKDRRPLGEILVRLGFIDINQLADALDSYVEHSSNVLAMHGSTVEAYLQTIEKRMRPKFDAIFRDFARGVHAAEDVKKILDSAISELVELRAGAKAIGGDRSERFLNTLIDMIERFDEGSASPECRFEIELIKIGMHIVYGLAEYIRDFNLEKMAESDPNMTDLMTRFWKVAEQIPKLSLPAAA